MGKRVVISLVAIMSLGAIWWTDAGAATCIQYRTIGGSSMCTAWSTKGVRVEVTFKQDCFTAVEGEVSVECSATATADTSDSIAFCDTGTAIVPTACDTFLRFTGNSNGPPSNGCVKHGQDTTGDGGVGHEHHGCKATFDLVTELASCTTNCCQRLAGPGGEPPAGPGGTCVDVTPVEMETTLNTIVLTAGGEVEPLVAGEPACSPNSPNCTITETCTINPKKIALNAVRPYQCNLECVNGDCVGEDEG